VRERLTRALFAASSVAIGALPLTLAQRLGAVAGALAWRLPTSAARITRLNVDLCFPGIDAKERASLARRSLAETGRLIAEYLYFSRAPEARWRQCVEAVVDAALLQPDTARSRGVLVLVPHFGNWELLNLYLGREHGLIAMYEPRRDAVLERTILESRSRTGSTMVPATPLGVRALYRGLQSGRVVALLPDQVPSRAAGVFAPFFGLPALTMTLPHRLVRRTGARVVLGCAQRLPGGRFEIRFEDLGDALAVTSEVEAATALNRAIESVIARAPAQYQWEYRRFRRRPAGHVPVY
jgi:KDO2-lipid IV(A) lauroyltransferase